MVVGFSFNHRHCSNLGVILSEVKHTILPQKRKYTYEIPGRDGTLDYGGETYDNRKIEVVISLVKGSMPQMRSLAREVAFWLSGFGLLIFDDEPDKAYSAKVFEQVDLDQIIAYGSCKVVFDCQPFAEEQNYAQYISSLSTVPKEMRIQVEGTQETPCLIIIKNKGTTNLLNIEILRKAGV